MPKIFNTHVIKKIFVQNDVSDDGEVKKNKLRVDWREKLAKVKTLVGLAPRVFEKVSFATTDAIVVIAQVYETFTAAVTVRIDAIASVYERMSTTVSHFIGLRTFERFTTRVSHLIGLRVFETFTARTSQVLSLLRRETVSFLDSHFIGLRTFEKFTAKTSQFIGMAVQQAVSFTATPSIKATARVTQPVSFAGSQAVAAKVVVPLSMVISHTFNGSGDSYANAVVSQTGITNANNALGNNTGNAATAVASSSGLAGITSNTTNFDLVLGIADEDLAGLLSSIDSVTVHLERAGANSGISVGGQGTVNCYWGFGGTPANLIDTGTWSTLGALAKGVVTADITANVANDWSNIDDLRLRFQGSSTSGTGLGATGTASFYRAWVEITASGTA